MDQNNADGVNKTKKKRRSSILKPTVNRAVLQDVQINVAENRGAVSTKVKSRRVSFSRTQQVKEFQTGSQTLTIWNNTYEEDHSHGSSVSAINTTANQSQPAQGQVSRAPLQITIPDANSPNKFLPTDPKLDTSNIFQAAEDYPRVNPSSFLQDIGGGGGGGAWSAPDDEPEECYATSLDKTCRDEVTMCRTMQDDTDDSTESSKLDALGFLAGLGDSSPSVPTNQTINMDMTCGINKTARMEMTCQNQDRENLDMSKMSQPSRDVHAYHGAEEANQEGQSNGQQVKRPYSQDWSVDSVFQSSPQFSSGNSSFDGGATATIKFSGLALANNTLMLPHRSSQDEEEEEEDMTRVPIQTINYNPEDPVSRHPALQRTRSLEEEEKAEKADGEPGSSMDITRADNRTTFNPTDMDITAAPVQPVSMDRMSDRQGYPNTERFVNKTVVQTDDMDITRATKNRTLAHPSDMDLTRNRMDDTSRTNAARTAYNKTLLHHQDMDMTQAIRNRSTVPNTVMDISAKDEKILSQKANSHDKGPISTNKTYFESEDMDMTGATKNKTQTHPSDMDFTRIGRENNIDVKTTVNVYNKTLVQSEDMDITRATRNKTEVQIEDMDMTRGVKDRIVSTKGAHAYNKTLIQSEDMDMTTAAKNKTLAQTVDMDMTKEQGQIQLGTIADQMKRSSDKTVLRPIDMDMTKAESVKSVSAYGTTEASNFQTFEFKNNVQDEPRERLATGKSESSGLKTFEFVQDKASKGKDLQARHEVDRLLREQFPSPAESPEPTAIIGMMPRINKSINFGDEVTSFLPGGESTRMINFRIPAPGELSPINSLQENPDQLHDITSFMPRVESTRRIDFPIGATAKPDFALSPVPSQAEVPSIRIQQAIHVSPQENIVKSKNSLANKASSTSSEPKLSDVDSYGQELKSQRDTEDQQLSDGRERISDKITKITENFVNQIADVSKVDNEHQYQEEILVKNDDSIDQIRFTDKHMKHSITEDQSIKPEVQVNVEKSTCQNNVEKGKSIHESIDLVKPVADTQNFLAQDRDADIANTSAFNSLEPPDLEARKSPVCSPKKRSCEDPLTFSPKIPRLSSDEMIPDTLKQDLPSNIIPSVKEVLPIIVTSSNMFEVPSNAISNSLKKEIVVTNLASPRPTTPGEPCPGESRIVSSIAISTTTDQHIVPEPTKHLSCSETPSSPGKDQGKNLDEKTRQSSPLPQGLQTLSPEIQTSDKAMDLENEVIDHNKAKEKTPEQTDERMLFMSKDQATREEIEMTDINMKTEIVKTNTDSMEARLESRENMTKKDNLILEHEAQKVEAEEKSATEKTELTKRKSLAVKIYTVFEDLLVWQSKKEFRDESDWILYDHDEKLRYAMFSWMENALALVVLIDQKLEPKRSRRSEGRVLTHYTIRSLELVSVRRSFEDPALDTALHMIQRKLPNSDLKFTYPNTHSLRNLLTTVSGHVEQSILLYRSLVHVERNNLCSISNHVVELEFASSALHCHFMMTADYSEGISNCIKTLTIKPRSGNRFDLSAITKIVSSATIGPSHLQIICDEIWRFFREKESGK